MIATKHQIIFKTNVGKYLKLKSLGYKTEWTGENQICMYKFYK